MSLRLVAPPSVAPGTSAVSLCAHKEDKDARKLLRAGRMSGATWQSCPLHWGARPYPNQTKTTRAHRARVVSPRLVCLLERCECNKSVGKARKDRPERARNVSVEGPDEPHSRSARNEGTGLSFRGRTLRLCPCVVMRGLRCVPRSKIRVASCIIPISVLSFWRDAYGVAWHTGSVVRRIAALA